MASARMVLAAAQQIETGGNIGDAIDAAIRTEILNEAVGDPHPVVWLESPNATDPPIEQPISVTSLLDFFQVKP